MSWGKIILAVLVAAALAYIGYYIYKAEENAELVLTLQAANAQLTEANKEMKKEYDLQLGVMQGTIKKKDEREKENAEATAEINAQPDSGCAARSKPILASLRLLRKASD